MPNGFETFTSQTKSKASTQIYEKVTDQLKEVALYFPWYKTNSQVTILKPLNRKYISEPGWLSCTYKPHGFDACSKLCEYKSSSR